MEYNEKKTYSVSMKRLQDGALQSDQCSTFNDILQLISGLIKQTVAKAFDAN